MKILGIETSCDETACSVVEDGVKVLSNVIASQVELHAATGGVVPEVAAREHILKVVPVIERALAEAGGEWGDIDAIAVTKGPGLISSLIIGTCNASAISYVMDKPVIPVHHIVGHVYANALDAGSADGLEFPSLVLTVSGGHNEIILMRDYDDFVILGETRDDAAGEAFDKVARILDLGYPGGPVISKVAIDGDREAFKLPRSYLEAGSLDFSFSGLKTAVLNEVKRYVRENNPDKEFGNYSQIGKLLPDKFKADLAASFQEAVCDVLSDKLIQAYLNLQEEGTHAKEIHLAGGVSANSRLREVMTAKIAKLGAHVSDDAPVIAPLLRFPKSLEYCTDNAAMIAGAAYFVSDSGKRLEKAPSNIAPTTNFDLF
ncbi:tRNA (adenosine(37)-N6)-threonylcarbamoyltransferase complex transferase subunit TsaD [Candidatus Peregrinibacteria bacterium]|nr:tRNA (adenosine(37)-N6)-threonylcarbamoyltransferase complex transferase subunit TsaD [Candidatus Peregrinibacteria bacterium]